MTRDPVLAGRSSPTRIGMGGVLIAVAGFGIGAGPIGVVTAIGVGAIWYLVGGVYGFAAGQVALVALPEIMILPAVIIEAGLGVVLLDPFRAAERSWMAIRVFGVVGVVLAAIIGATLRGTGSVVLAALTLAGVTGVLLYGIHRYELVMLLREDARIVNDVSPSGNGSLQMDRRNNDRSTKMDDTERTN